MNDREAFEQAYTKDKHTSVRVVFQETFTLGKGGKWPGGTGQQGVLCTVLALYVMDLSILSVDAKVLTTGHTPFELQDEATFTKRVLETHDFPKAVRRAVALADEIREEMRLRVGKALGESFVAAPPTF